MDSLILYPMSVLFGWNNNVSVTNGLKSCRNCLGLGVCGVGGFYMIGFELVLLIQHLFYLEINFNDHYNEVG